MNIYKKREQDYCCCDSGEAGNFGGLEHPLLQEALQGQVSDAPRGPVPPWAAVSSTASVDRTATGATPPRSPLPPRVAPPGLPEEDAQPGLPRAGSTAALDARPPVDMRAGFLFCLGTFCLRGPRPPGRALPFSGVRFIQHAGGPSETPPLAALGGESILTGIGCGCTTPHARDDRSRAPGRRSPAGGGWEGLFLCELARALCRQDAAGALRRRGGRGRRGAELAAPPAEPPVLLPGVRQRPRRRHRRGEGQGARVAY